VLPPSTRFYDLHGRDGTAGTILLRPWNERSLLLPSTRSSVNEPLSDRAGVCFSGELALENAGIESLRPPKPCIFICGFPFPADHGSVAHRRGRCGQRSPRRRGSSDLFRARLAARFFAPHPYRTHCSLQRRGPPANRLLNGRLGRAHAAYLKIISIGGVNRRKLLGAPVVGWIAARPVLPP